jgi:hypothetical protein
VQLPPGILVKSAFSDVSSDALTSPEVLVPAGAGLLGGAALAGRKAHQLYHEPLTRKPVITIGGGRIKTEGGDTGAGHITHATALTEALQNQSAVRSGDVLLQSVMPNTHAIPKLPEHGYSDLTVTTGYSGLPKDRFDPHFLPETIAPESMTPEQRAYTGLKGLRTGKHVHFTPDTPFVFNAILAEPKSIWQRLSNMVGNLGRKRLYYNTVLFGNKKLISPMPFAHYSTAPTFTNKALAGIQAAHADTRPTSEIFEDWAKTMEKDNPEAAAYVRKGIADASAAGREYKPILITGSSRGDYVAKKTLDLAGALKGQPEEHTYHLIPILGARKNITGKLFENTGLPSIGGLPPDLYSKLRGAAALNVASSGPGDLTELRALATPTVVPLGHEQLRDAEIEMLGDRITPLEKQQLATIETEKWNLGGLQDLHTEQPAGMKLYRNADEILVALRDPKFMDRAAHKRRALHYLQEAINAKADLAGRFIREAYNSAHWANVKSRPGQLALHGGLGALGLGAAGYGGYKAIEHLRRPEEKTAGISVSPAFPDAPPEETWGEKLAPAAPYAIGAGGTVAGGLGIHGADRLLNMLTRKGGTPTITVAGGRFSVPGLDVGAGHAAPAQAIVEALAEHPAVRSGDVRVQGLYPKNFQLQPGEIKHPHSHLTVTTGYSGLPSDIYEMSPTMLKVMAPDAKHPGMSPELRRLTSTRAMQFLTDPQRAITHKNIWEKLKQGLQFLPFAPKMISAHFDPNMIRFGDAGSLVPSYWHFPVNPAISEKSLTPIRDMLERKLRAEDTYEELAAHLHQAGNPEAAAYIRKGIAGAAAAGRSYKPVMVTGSSRGDNVAQRALDYHHALKQMERGHEVQLIPNLGLHGNITKTLFEGTDLPVITQRIPQELYAKVRGTAAALASGLGASEFAEAQGLPVPILVSENPRAVQLREIENIQRRRHLPAGERRNLENARTDMFNEGQLQELLRRKIQGVTVSDDPKELERILFGPGNEQAYAHNLARAKQHLAAMAESKRTLVDRLVREARDAAKHGKVPLWWRHPYALGASALAAGVGSGVTYQIFKNKREQAAKGEAE